MISFNKKLSPFSFFDGPDGLKPDPDPEKFENRNPGEGPLEKGREAICACANKCSEARAETGGKEREKGVYANVARQQVNNCRAPALREDRGEEGEKGVG